MPPTLQAFRRQYPNDKNFVRGRVPSLRPNIITKEPRAQRYFCDRGRWEIREIRACSAGAMKSEKLLMRFPKPSIASNAPINRGRNFESTIRYAIVRQSNPKNTRQMAKPCSNKLNR
jgi:hypothetical protein